VDVKISIHRVPNGLKFPTIQTNVKQQQMIGCEFIVENLVEIVVKLEHIYVIADVEIQPTLRRLVDLESL
jgi:hypothetical protein